MPNSKLAVRFLQVLTALIALTTLVGVIAFYLYPPWGATLLVAMGRGPSCEAHEALQALLRAYRQGGIEHHIGQICRVKYRDANYQQIETPHGTFWEPAIQGSAVLAQLAELEAKYSNFGKQPIRRDDVVLDCGANVGTFTREALQEGAKLVVAIEPAPNNLECLRRNFSSEVADGRVIIFPKGVWDKEDFLTLAENNSTSAMDSFVKLEGTHPGPRVALTTIDTLVDDLKLERVDFIKMDIEGAEQRALRGAAKILQRYQPRLEISVNHLPEDPERVPEIIRHIQPVYHVQCLQCVMEKWRIRSEILYFY